MSTQLTLLHSKKADTSPCITFSSPSAFTVTASSPKWEGTVEYSTNGTSWSVWNGATVSSGSDKKLYFRGTGNQHITATTEDDATAWAFTGSQISCDGEIDTLLDYAQVKAGVRPAVGDCCFRSMFYGCTALIKAPELPLLTLPLRCYSYMFRGCTSLAVPPAIPATTVVAGDNCQCMFRDCSALVAIPALYSLTLVHGCYEEMFRSCSSLKTGSSSTSAMPNAYRIPFTGMGTASATNWGSNMFRSIGTSGVVTPTINTTFYTNATIIG